MGKRKKIRITPEQRERWDATRRLLAERVAILDKKIAAQKAARERGAES